MRYFSAILCFALMAAACNDGKVYTEGQDDGFVTDRVKVLEYSPAPGQFINEDHEPTDAADAVRWAQGRIDRGEFVSLGAFGGYIVLKPSRSIANGEGYDFGIAGNAITSQNEPGVVWVSRDDNGNGLPDDQWYELAGSETGRRGYTVTYHATAEPGDVRWEDGDGTEGTVDFVPQHHTQNYYPAWCDNDGTITLSGTLLPAKSSGDGDRYNIGAYGWGYADNMGSDAVYTQAGRYIYNRFDLSHAVKADGSPVTLQSIDFVKVQSGVLDNVGHLGEVSTEVNGLLLPE